MKRIAVIAGVVFVFTTVGYLAYCLLLARTYRDEITDTFETTNSVVRIRVNRHSEKGPGFALGAYYVFQSATAASDNWDEIMTFRHDDPIEIPRNQIRFANDQLGYVFMGWMYAVTTDGGRNWTVWNAEQDLPGWDCCNYGLVEDVEIGADGAGKMKLHRIPGRQGEVPELNTQDYGRHWSVPDKVAEQRGSARPANQNSLRASPDSIVLTTLSSSKVKQ